MKFRIFYETNSLKGMAIFCMMIAMPLCFFTSCNWEKKEFVDFEFDGETSYNVKTTDVIMFISDS